MSLLRGLSRYTDIPHETHVRKDVPHETHVHNCRNKIPVFEYVP